MKASRLPLYHETYDARALCDARLIGDHAPHYQRRADRFGGPVLELGAGTTRLGNQVVELVDVGQQFPSADGGEPTTVFHGVDLVIEPGARLAVVGPNGSGKTTLLDIIAGRGWVDGGGGVAGCSRARLWVAGGGRDGSGGSAGDG